MQDAPLKIAIRGGTDTPLGGQILISRILEGGAADKYGQSHVCREQHLFFAGKRIASTALFVIGVSRNDELNI